MDLNEIIKHLNIESLAMVGISIGGQIAMEYALHYEQRVTCLIVSNTALKIGNKKFWDDRVCSLMNEGLDKSSSSLVSRWFSEAFIQRHPKASKHYRSMIANTELLSYLFACEAIGEENLEYKISALDVPMLCIGSTNDISTPIEELVKITRLNKKAEYRQLDGPGHLSCIEQGSLFAELIRNFVDHE